MPSSIRHGLLAASLVLLLGCSDDGSPSQDGAVPDSTVDSAVDSGKPDGGVAADQAAADQAPQAVIHVDDLDDGQQGSGTEADPYRDLQHALDQAPDGALLRIHAGTYTASPVAYDDPTCGNCSDADFTRGAKATRGFLVEGKALHLQGDGKDQTVLVTGAGYGVLFQDAGSSSVTQLKVTGGKRDASQDATDAGIVVRNTSLTVTQVSVSDNDDRYQGSPDPVVGVGGIFGREGSNLVISDSEILNNSWDGIALYRGDPQKAGSGPTATITGCLVGCVSGCDKDSGRGVGIGVTWDASATIVGNVVHHYWKGIGAFGNSVVRARNNVLRDQDAWGFSATGTATLHAQNNVVLRCGTTGFWVQSKATGSFVNNVVTGNGILPSGWTAPGMKTGIWYNSSADKVKLAYNIVHGNTGFDVCSGGSEDKGDCNPLPYDGVNGNLDADPQFKGQDDFHLAAGSPAVDSGDPGIKDVDGSRSDIGVYGGPDAPQNLP